MSKTVDEAIIEITCSCGSICDEHYFEKYHWYRCTVCGKMWDDPDAEKKVKQVRHTFDDGVYRNA